MLNLSDPQWSQFSANYTEGTQVAHLIARAESGEEVHLWFDELHQELIHQYTVSPATYPAAPHLVRLAGIRKDARTELLVLLGLCHAFSDPSVLHSMTPGIAEEWYSSAREARVLVAEELKEEQTNASQFIYLLTALAALSGFPTLARSLEAVDYEDN